MRRGPYIPLILALWSLTSAPPLLAAPDDAAKAMEHWQRGQTHFRLARFDEAAAEFKKGYELKNAPRFLFNIAQAYRLKGPDRPSSQTREAIFFYKQYLVAEQNIANRAEIEGWLAELEKELEVQLAAEAEAEEAKRLAAEQEARRKRELAATQTNAPAAAPAPATQVEDSAEPKGERRLQLAVDAGFTKLHFGKDAEQAPGDISLQFGGLYDVYRGRARVGVGLMLGIDFAGYETPTGDEKEALVLSVSILSRNRLPLNDRLSLRGDVGIGTLLLSRLADGNPWTNMGEDKAAISFLAFYGGVGIDYRVGDRLILQASPVGISYAPKSLILRGDDSDLGEDVNHVVRLDILSFGFSYLF